MTSAEFPILSRRSLTLILCFMIAFTLLSPALLVGVSTLFERRFKRMLTPPPTPMASSTLPQKKLAPHEEWKIEQLGSSVASLQSDSSDTDEVQFRFVNYLPGPSWQTRLSRSLAFPATTNEATLSIEIRAERARTVTISLLAPSNSGDDAQAEVVDVNTEWKTHRWNVSSATPGQIYRLVLGVGADPSAISVRSVGWENPATEK